MSAAIFSLQCSCSRFRHNCSLSGGSKAERDYVTAAIAWQWRVFQWPWSLPATNFAHYRRSYLCAEASSSLDRLCAPLQTQLRPWQIIISLGLFWQGQKEKPSSIFCASEFLNDLCHHHTLLLLKLFGDHPRSRCVLPESPSSNLVPSLHPAATHTLLTCTLRRSGSSRAHASC